MKRTYKLNEDFFEKVDSEAKAYFLGLAYADGYNQTVRVSKCFLIQLKEEDKEILEIFRNVIESDYNLKLIKKRKNSHCDAYRLQVNSKKFCEDLIKLGCVGCKSKILKFPTDEQVPPHLIHHFIRCYFDGDGCVWEGKRKKVTVKDKQRKSGFRERIIHNVKFNIVGTEFTNESIQNILMNSLGFKKTKLYYFANCTQLEYSGRTQMKLFYKYLYNNATIFFQRKRNKFEKILSI